MRDKGVLSYVFAKYFDKVKNVMLYKLQIRMIFFSS